MTMTIADTAQRQGPPREGVLARHPLVSFFLLAFAFTWGYFWLILVPLNLPGPLFALGAAGPTVSAFLVLALTSGKPGVLRLLRSMVHWRVGVQWYLVTLLGVPALMLLSYLVVPGGLADFRAPDWSFRAVKATSGMPCSGNDVVIGHGIAAVVAEARCPWRAGTQSHTPQPSTAMSSIPNSRLVSRGLAAAWGDAAEGPPTCCCAGRPSGRGPGRRGVSRRRPAPQQWHRRRWARVRPRGLFCLRGAPRPLYNQRCLGGRGWNAHSRGRGDAVQFNRVLCCLLRPRRSWRYATPWTGGAGSIELKCSARFGHRRASNARRRSTGDGHGGVL